MTRGERRMQRNRPRAVACLGFVFVGLAVIAIGNADPWIDPDQRTSLTFALFLVAYTAGSLVVGSRRRRT